GALGRWRLLGTLGVLAHGRAAALAAVASPRRAVSGGPAALQSAMSKSTFKLCLTSLDRQAQAARASLFGASMFPELSPLGQRGRTQATGGKLIFLKSQSRCNYE